MAEKRADKRSRSAEAAEDLFDDLFSSTAGEDNGLPRDRDAVMIDRDLIEPGPFQTRKYFPKEALAELGQSLRDIGQQQPIVVRPHPKKRGRYQLVAGERRWRASAPNYGDLPMLRATLRNLSDYEVARIVLDENEKREDVSPLARARGLQRLYEVSPGTLPDGTPDLTSKPTWDQVAASVGLTKRSALRLVELLELPEKVQDKLEELNLSEKHGRALLMLREDARAQAALLREIEPEKGDEERAPRLSGNAALRRAEEVRKFVPKPKPGRPAEIRKEPDSPGSDSVSRETKAPIDELQRGTGFDQGSAPQPARYDPLDAHLRPALAQVTEAARRVAETPASPAYRRDVLQTLERLEAEAARIRMGLEEST